MAARRQRVWGMVYRRRSRGKLTRWWWLLVQFPGEPRRRQPTNPRTEDRAEAERQLHELLGERSHARRARITIETVTVDDLLDLYVLDCADHGRSIQVGRVEPWRSAFGARLALDVTRLDLDDLCRRWQSRGPAWRAGSRTLSTGDTIAWPTRDPKRVRPLSGASLNRLVSVFRRAYRLGQEKLGLPAALTFPHFAEGKRGEYITEDQCVAICAHFRARFGASVKADLFRLAYLTGIRKGQLRRTAKRHVHIQGDVWKLVWPKEDTKNGRAHAVVLAGEERAIVQRAWAARLPDCDFLFHVDGKPLGPMRSELARTCKHLGIPYGRSSGVVFHDTRHSAVTNLVASGTGEAAAMSITGHADPSVFRRYNVRRDAVQAEAAERRDAYLARQRGTAPAVPVLTPRRS